MDSEIGSGLHTIQFGNRLVDVLVEDRGSDLTTVVFHGNLSNPASTIPAFEGRGITSRSGVNLIAVSDPSLALTGVSLSWFLGDRWIGRARTALTPLITHALEQLGAKETVLLGGSGGGYAATNFGRDFPGAIVVAMNPRLRLHAEPRADLETYWRVCHKAESRTPILRASREYVPSDLAEELRGGLPFELLLLQNSGDTIYKRGQFDPFVAVHREDSSLWVRLDDLGVGHLPFAPAAVAGVLGELAKVGVPRIDRFKAAGFAPGVEF